MSHHRIKCVCCGGYECVSCDNCCYSTKSKLRATITNFTWDEACGEWVCLPPEVTDLPWVSCTDGVALWRKTLGVGTPTPFLSAARIPGIGWATSWTPVGTPNCITGRSDSPPTSIDFLLPQTPVMCSGVIATGLSTPAAFPEGEEGPPNCYVYADIKLEVINNKCCVCGDASCMKTSDGSASTVDDETTGANLCTEAQDDDCPE